MKISVIHATRNRPKQALEARQQMLSAAIHPSDIEYIFAVDDDDTGTREAIHDSGLGCVTVDTSQGFAGCNRAWNAGARLATGDLILNSEDDVLFPLGWDQELCEAAEPVAIQDVVINLQQRGTPHPIYGLRAFTRERFNRLGWILCPEYEGLFSDFDAFWHARMEGKLVMIPTLRIEHRHPNFGHTEVAWDEGYKRQHDQERFQRDMATFNRRWPGALKIIEQEVGGFAKATGKKVFWGVLPERCLYDVSFTTGLKLSHHNALKGYVPMYPNYGPTDSTRNAMALSFLEQSTHPKDTLVMLDIDHEHPHNIVERLVARDLPVVIPLVFNRGEPYECLAFRRNGDDTLHSIYNIESKLYEVDAVTTSAIAIQRWVFQELQDAGHQWFFKYEYLPKMVRPTEDLYFCKICREAGIKMFMDATFETPHVTIGYVDRSVYEAYRKDNPRKTMQHQGQHEDMVNRVNQSQV